MTDSRTGRGAILWLAIGVAAVAGCHHRPAPAPVRGNTSFRIIESHVSAGGKGEAVLDTGQPREIVAPAEPFLPLALPVFPPAALRARDAGALVSVHVTVDRKGSVTSVTPSLFGFTSPGPFASEYRSAVQTAVMKWEFQPAEIQSIEIVRGADGNASRKITRREPTEAEFDVAFMFTSSGEVVAPKR